MKDPHTHGQPIRDGDLEGADARRERMLDELQGHLRRRVRRQKLVRASAAAGLVMVTGASWWVLSPGTRNPAPIGLPVGPVAGQDRPTTPEVAAEPGLSVTHAAEKGLPPIEHLKNVPTRPSGDDGTPLATRVTNLDSPAIVIGDRELIDNLRWAGVDDGLIRVRGSLRLAREVAGPIGPGETNGPQSRTGTGGMGHPVVLADSRLDQGSTRGSAASG